MITYFSGSASTRLFPSLAYSPQALEEAKLARATFNDAQAKEAAIPFTQYAYLLPITSGDYIKIEQDIFRADVERFFVIAEAITASTTSFSITGSLASINSVSVNQLVVGPGIPKNARVQSVNTTSQIVTLNLNTLTASETKKNIPIYFSTAGDASTLTATSVSNYKQQINPTYTGDGSAVVVLDAGTTVSTGSKIVIKTAWGTTSVLNGTWTINSASGTAASFIIDAPLASGIYTSSIAGNLSGIGTSSVYNNRLMGNTTLSFEYDLMNLDYGKINNSPPLYFNNEDDGNAFRSYFGAWSPNYTVFKAGFNNDGNTSSSALYPGLDAGTFESSINTILLLKSSFDEGYDNFKTIAQFDSSQFNNTRYFYDYLVEPGMLYRYKFQGANTQNSASSVILTRGATTAENLQPQIIPDFTGSYLYGEGDIQVNFIYNGAINGFREVKKDAVIETIGGKYPFVVRNSNIGYKQFQFSAIITHVSDPTRSLKGLTYSELLSKIQRDPTNNFIKSAKAKNNFVDERYEDFILNGSALFNTSNPADYVTLSDNGRVKINRQTYINRSDNFIIEKQFRKKLMEWLYDGNPKVFKSDTEGLFLVKLTDISFEPVVETGRIIYTFSCTMTEIGPTDLDSLIKYGIKKSRYEDRDLYIVSNINNFTIEWDREVYFPEGQYFFVNGEDGTRFYLVSRSGTTGGEIPTGQDPDTVYSGVIPEASSANVIVYQYTFIGYSIPGQF
jgi:hypothetical protein